MAIEGTLKYRNGALYVLYIYDEEGAPVRQHIWYRVLGTRSTGYGAQPEAGDLATLDSAGDWWSRNPTTHRSTGYVSTGPGGAELVEWLSIPPPAIGGKQLRWHQGRWEKLMARGWVPAGEGKAKTAKKALAHSTQKAALLEKDLPDNSRERIATALSRHRSFR